MTEDEESADFNATRAELFEAISHPLRIKILQTLSDQPMGFADLRRAVGIESGGQLGFHLTKLAHLVKTTPEGTYALTGDGREALWSVNALRKSSNGPTLKSGQATVKHGNWAKPVVAGLLVVLVVLGGVAAFQQQQIGLLQNSLSNSRDSSARTTAVGPSGDVAWAPTTSYPGTFGEGCVTSSGYVYCSGGIDYGAAYAPISSSGVGAWTSTNDFSSRGDAAVCVGSSGYIYCIWDNTAGFAPLSSQGIGKWVPTTSYPENVQGPEGGYACVAYSGYVYCVGGSTTQTTGTNATNASFYAPISPSGIGSWSPTTSYPTPIAGHSCVTSLGYIYCVGGFTGLDANATPTGTTITYFAKLSKSGIGTWSPTSSYPSSSPVFWNSCVSYSAGIYCVGGDGNATYLAKTSSSGLGAWTQGVPYPIPAGSLTCVTDSSVSDSRIIYCVGGFKTHAVYYTTVPFVVGTSP